MYGAVGAAGWLGLTYIFYHDFLIGFISMLPFLYFFFRWIRKSLHEKQIQRIRREFQELIQLLSGAFRTGHSAENAMQEASEQLSMMEGETAYMVQVMQTMLTKMSLGEPAEQVWLSFADACEIEEVKEFAKAFALAKRSGASMPFILQKIASQLVLKVQTQSQIETMLAGKKLEQKIMNLMPVGILLYLSVTSPQLLSVMYETMTGKMIMTVCLFIYITAYLLSERITRLEWYHSAISEMEESFLFTEYLLEHCRSFTSTGETNKMAYELEYILNGKTSDKENLKSTVNSLLLMREGLNLFSAWKDPVLSSQAETAAATLVGWTGVYPAIKLTQFTMIAGWSFAEAIVDVRTLLSGGNIPIIKNSESWTLEFSQIADFLDGDLFLTAKENNGLSYDEYLRLLLYAQGRSDRRYHTMDVIQLRMREKNPDFSMADCLGAVQVKASMKAAPIFYCFAGSGYEISCEQSRMY